MDIIKDKVFMFIIKCCLLYLAIALISKLCILLTGWEPEDPSAAPGILTTLYVFAKVVIGLIDASD